MRSIITLAAVFLVGTAPLAFATEATGILKDIDAKADTITLDDGHTYYLAEGTEADPFHVGDRIAVTFHQAGAKRVATKLAIAAQ